jgi:hypothetical protein
VGVTKAPRFHELSDLALSTVVLWTEDPAVRADSPELVDWLSMHAAAERARRAGGAPSPLGDADPVLPDLQGHALVRATRTAAHLCIACELTAAATDAQRRARDELLDLTAWLAESLVDWWRSRQATRH